MKSVLIFLILALFANSVHAARIGKALSDFTRDYLSLDMPLFKNYLITSYKVRPSSTGKNEIVELGGQSGAYNLLMEIRRKTVRDAEFENFKNSNLIIIRNLYRPMPTPYPGALTKNDGCSDQDSRPVEYEFEDTNSSFYVLEGGASNRFVFGVCDRAEKTYQGILVIFKTKGFYGLIKIFVPYKDYLRNKNYFREVLK